MTPHLKLLEHLYAALNEPIGVVISSEDREYTIQKLYVLRREEAPTFDDLVFIQSSTPSELWIVKRNPDASRETGPDEAHITPSAR